MLVLVYAVGTCGYMWLEDYSYIDASYMTIITVASVGFSEVKPLSDVGKIFTSLLILSSVFTYVYAITVVTSFIVEGEFRTYFNHIRVNKEIQELRGHVIVCGYGRNGRQACQQLKAGNVRYVVIESKTQIIEHLREEGVLCLEGNATEDEVLHNAGIRHAKGLIAALPDDAANVFVVLTARELNSTMKIVSRASSDASESKLRRAGADNVIMPDKIGGTHLAALITKPDVLEFIDHITVKTNIRLEEIHCHELPQRLIGKPLSELTARDSSGAKVIGFRHGSGEYLVNPADTTLMLAECKLFVLGSPEQVMGFMNQYK